MSWPGRTARPKTSTSQFQRIGQEWAWPTQKRRAMALNPAKRLGLPGGRLAEGAPADLVLFDPDKPFVMDRSTLRSKSKNTPFDGQRMQGRVLATYVGGAQVYEAE